MIQANFSFARLSETDGRFEILAQAFNDDKGRGVRLTYKFARSEADALEVVHVAELPGYSLWSEAPLALILRALFLLQTTWYRHVPRELFEGVVGKMKVSVRLLYSNGWVGSTFAKFVLSQVPGDSRKYVLLQLLPEDSCHAMQVHEGSAFPLGAALKAVAALQPHLTHEELQVCPAALTLPEVSDYTGTSYVMRESVPDYALRAFEAHSPSLRLHRDGLNTAPIPATEWQAFLAV